MTLPWDGGVCIPSLSSGGLVEVILGDLGCQVPGGSGPLLPGWKSCSRRLQGPGEGLTAGATLRHRNPATWRDLGLQGTRRVSAEPPPAPNACSQNPALGRQKEPTSPPAGAGAVTQAHSNCKLGQGQAACAREDMLVACTKLKPSPRSQKTHHPLAYQGGGTAAA